MQQKVKPTVEQMWMWRDICMAKKPCPVAGTGPGGICSTCSGTGQVWLLSELQQQCYGDRVGSAQIYNRHTRCGCGGSGWLPIEFDAIALLTALDRQFMAAWEGHRVTETLVSVSLAEATPAGLEHEATGTGADYGVALIMAAHKALGLEAKDAVQGREEGERW